MENEAEQLREELKRREAEHKIELTLAKNRVRNLRAAMAIFQPEKMEQNEDGEPDVEGSVATFKKENGWLFEEDRIVSTARPHGNAESRSYDRMTDEEYYRTVSDMN